MSGTLVLLRGLPASGKSTWARQYVASHEAGRAIRLNRDDLRRSLIDPDYRVPIYTAEQRITAVQRQAARDALLAGVNVVVDDTNLRLKFAREWATLAQECGAELDVRDFTDVTVDQCIARDARRGGVERVGEDVIRGMHAKFLASGPLGAVVPREQETLTAAAYTPIPGTPRAVMVDIDGTVALHGDRSPYDPTRYHEDTPNDQVIDLIQRLAWAGESSVRLVFCSGRDETYRDVTERWLWDHIRLPFNTELFMRPAGDKRNDAVVKLELFDKHIRHTYDVVCVFDDRDRVVKAWRSIGLTCLQVAEGNF